MSESFEKIVFIGKVNVTNHGVQRKSVFCKIKFHEGVLSISGVIQPRVNGNCHSCGQILDILKDSDWVLEKNWDRAKKQRFHQIWRDWHLNDMRPVTPKQMEAAKAVYPKIKSYDDVCSHLKSIGLYEDNGYKYGSAWLTEEVPAEDIAFLKSLPDASKQPAWV